MKVLIVGGGGREHALAWKFAQSERVNKVFVAPGNGGTAIMRKGTNVDINVDDIDGLKAFAKKENIDITMIGPEGPLVEGIVDAFREDGLKVFGPDAQAARLEGSKSFAKRFMEKYGIPTANFKVFEDYEEAKKNVGIFGYPMVIKADGLASGKGVVIAKTEEEALEAFDDMMVKKIFGDAGSRVLVEEFLGGLEASMICFVDGKNIVPMESVQDYKRIHDDNEGPNTGGMGTYSPNLIYTDTIEERVKELVIEPVRRGIEAENMDFKGVIFIGLMIDGKDVRVIEFNVRFGDPETQVIMPKMENDLLDITEAVLEQRLHQVKLKWSQETYICVVLASEGYPASYPKGRAISGLENCNLVFHSGTQLDENTLKTSGGRVLGIIGSGENIKEARQSVYGQLQNVTFEGMQYRTDIGMLIRNQ